MDRTNIGEDASRVNQSSAMSAAEIARALGNEKQSGDEWHCSCPNTSAHSNGDSHPSFSIREEGGKLLWRCHAGCSQMDTTRAMKERGLTQKKGRSVKVTKDRELVATHQYKDEKGVLLFEVLRFRTSDGEKDISQRTPIDGGKWNYSVGGVRRPIYRLPEVRAAIAAKKGIYIVEGEKCADALAAHGICATTNPGGALKWSDHHTQEMAGAPVAIVLPDNDELGHQHADEICKRLHNAGIEVRRLVLPGLKNKQDVYDWLQQGHTAEELRALARSTEKWQPQEFTEIEQTQNAPWQDAPIPENFSISEDGLFYTNGEGEPVKVSGPIYVKAQTSDYEGGRFGFTSSFVNLDGAIVTVTIPREQLHEKGTSLVQSLASAGLYIQPGQEQKLIRYLATASAKATKRARCVDRLGYVDTTSGTLIFVTPNEVISPADNDAVDGKEIVFQPEKHSPTSSTMKSSGELEDWQQNVAFPCKGNHLRTFALAAGFAGSLSKPLQMDSGGFNFHGVSSIGKTLLLQLAASTQGCGADPGDAPGLAYILKWNSTTNALEGLAAASNDGLLILDELGSSSARDFGKAVYDLFGGQGKNAMDASRNLKKARSWRIVVLSSGEISARQKIEEERVAKGGQLLRLIDIAVDGGDQ